MNNKIDTIKYILISILIFIVAVLFADIMRLFLVESKLFSLSYEQAALIASMIEGAVGAIAAGFVLYELKINSKVQEHENDIEEAQFLLQYNQAFIQDEKMCETESQLESWMIADLNEESFDDENLIKDENRQAFVNYLVYLEGLAPLIFRGILKIEHIDDLMAYRFFLALNNPCVQKDQIFKFPDYYRGSIKLYNFWKKYRETNGLPILLSKYDLEKWEKFKIFASGVNIRKCNSKDNFFEIADLIYDTDPYIYPAAFRSKSRARHIMKNLMSEKCIFNRNNIRVAEKDGLICGIALVVADKNFSNSPNYFNESNRKSVISVNKHYFTKIPELIKNDKVYIACVCVNRKYRGKGVGEALIRSVLEEFSTSTIVLDVLEDNRNAIELYKKCGFQEYEHDYGYSQYKKKPMCFRMILKG